MHWLIIYAIIMLVCGLWHTRYRADLVSFYVCGRKAGTASVAFSILASCIGGSATIGMAGLAWEAGVPAFWWLGSGAVGLALLAYLLAARIRATNALTMPGVVIHFLGTACQKISALIILFSSLAIIAAQFSALGIMIGSIADLDFSVSCLSGAFFLLLYTFLGGQQAVIKSDIWQFLILAAALFLAFIILLQIPDCRNTLGHAELEFTNKTLPPARVTYFFLVFGSSFLVGPMIFGRILSSRTPDIARKGSWFAAAGMAFMAGLITCLGLAMQALPIRPALREDALFAAITGFMPPWAVICITLGMISAVISSADSCLMTASTICASALLQKSSVPWTRASMCVITVVSLGLAFSGKDILALLLAASDIYVCGVVPAVFISVIWGPAKRKGQTLYLAGMIGGGSLGLWAALNSQPVYSFSGLAFSLLFSILGALLDRRNTHAR